MSELHEAMARAMRAQGKVDPDEVFAEAEVTDLDDSRPGDTYAWEGERNANRRAREQGCAGTITVSDVRAILAPRRCHYCKTRTDDLRLDHVEPLHLGGPNVRENIVPACDTCSRRKGGRPAMGRWSERHDCCARCGTTDRRHSARGYCNACYLAVAKEQR